MTQISVGNRHNYDEDAQHKAVRADPATGQILDLLSDGRIWRLSEISARIGVHGATVIHLAERGRIVRVARGQYAMRGLYRPEPDNDRPPSPAQLSLLKLLAIPRSVGDLKTSLGVSRQAVHRTLSQLVMRGLVRRSRADRSSRYEAVEPCSGV